MRTLKRDLLPMLSLITISILSLLFLFPAHAAEYRLLKLDGYLVKWGDPQLGVGAQISYAFTGESLQFDGAINCGELAPVQSLNGNQLSMKMLKNEASAAFQAWESAADLFFFEVDDPRDADIILGVQGKPQGRAYANVTYAPETQDGVRSIEKALVCLNDRHEWKIGFDGNEDIYDIRYTLIHEIGHAIGLDHPGRTGQIMGFRYSEAYSDLQPGDLRGVQMLYGPATENRQPLQAVDPDLSAIENIYP